MKHQTNEICVLGGFFSVIDYIINQISNILNNFGTYNFFKIMAICFDKLSALLKQKYEKNNENMYSFAQLYKNDAPYIGLYFKTSTILTNKSVKGDFEPTWSNYFRNITL